MREGEAVLARNVMGDSSLGSRDSQGEILATSVLCAPIRRGRKVYGLIHLYSTNTELVPDPDDLEFTLAVADTVAVARENLNRRQNWPRTSRRSAPKTCSSASGWACAAKSSARATSPAR